MNFEIAAWRGRIHRFNNFCRVKSNHWPLRRAKNDDCYLSIGKVLLISDVFVSGQKNVEPGPFRFSQQVAVRKSIPTAICRLGDFVPSQVGR